MDAERCNGRIQLSSGYPKALCACIEGLARTGIDARIALEWQIVRAVGACARKTVALDGVGDGVRNAHRVVGVPLGNGFGAVCEASLCLDHGPRKRSRVPTVDVDRIEAADCQMRAEPIGAALLRDLGSLLDTTSVEDHDWDNEAAIFCAPPARGPIAAALLFKRPVTEKRDDALALERHVHVFEFSEAEIAAFGNSSCRMRIDMAADRSSRAAIGADRIGIEVRGQARETLLGSRVTALLRRRHVADEDVDRLDRSDAVALTHDP